MAGLSLESGVVRFIELEGGIGNLKVARKGEVSTETGVIQQDMVSDFAALEQALNALKAQIGGHWPRQAAIGIPPRDVLIRVVELPSMSAQDAREAFKWEFDKYFPFSSLEATFDLAPITLPADEPGGLLDVEGPGFHLARRSAALGRRGPNGARSPGRGSRQRSGAGVSE